MIQHVYAPPDIGLSRDDRHVDVHDVDLHVFDYGSSFAICGSIKIQSPRSVSTYDLIQKGLFADMMRVIIVTNSAIVVSKFGR